MAKTSLDYAELAGIAITISNLSIKKDKSEEENIVLNWLKQRSEILSKQ